MVKNNPITGARYLIQGLKLIFRPELRRYVATPLLVNILVFSALIWLGAAQFSNLLDWMIPDSSWFSFLRVIMWPIFAVAAVLMLFYTFTLVANLIAAPFNGILAEQVELLITGRYPAQPKQDLAKAVLPALRSELRKISYFLIRAIPLLLLFVIPVINSIAPILWLLFNVWYVTLEYADYPMANSGLDFTEQHAQLKGIRMATLGFGGGITLLMVIPILNLVAMPAAVSGATALWSITPISAG